MKTLQLAILLFGLSSFSEATTLKTSFYNKGFIGKPTASGEIFNPYKNTAASNRHKFGTILQLSYKGKKIKVCVNDTGSFTKVDLDVSLNVIRKLNIPIKKGVVTVESKVIFKPKKNISCTTAWRLI